MANSYREYLKMKKYGGEGGDTPSPTLISKTINANGLYLPEDDQADGYNSVSVNVPEVSDIAFVPPQKFKSNGSNLEDYKIFGSDGVVIETETSVLPLTFTTTEDKLRDWEIRGNDDNGTENLMRVIATSKTQNGITFTVDSNGRITINGKATANVSLYIDWASDKASAVNVVEPSTTYTVSGGLNTTGIMLYWGTFNSDDTHTQSTVSTSATFTTDTTAEKSRAFIFVTSGTVCDNLVCKPMLVKGSTAPDHYIPYQQGVGERTANLFDISTVVDGYINANGVLTAGTQLQGEKTSDYIEIDSSTAYTISAVGGFPSLTGYQAWRSIAYYDSNKSFLERIASQGTSDLSATSGSTAKYARISYRSFGVANLQIMLVQGSTAPSTYVPFGYEIPISVNGNAQTFYIGNTPLRAGQSISKTSTGVDIATTEGENTISTTLYNKPETSVTYAESGGVGEEVSGSYVIPIKINSTTTNVPIGDTPLMEDEYVSYAEQKIYRYVDGTLTPVDPPSALPQIATANGVNDLSVETDIQPELVQIGLGIPVELIPVALGTKNITANDTYDASDDSLDGYSSVTVNVPEKVLTTKTITASGTYNAVDDQADGYRSVTVNVRTYNEVITDSIITNVTEVTE